MKTNSNTSVKIYSFTFAKSGTRFLLLPTEVLKRKDRNQTKSLTTLLPPKASTGTFMLTNWERRHTTSTWEEMHMFCPQIEHKREGGHGGICILHACEISLCPWFLKTTQNKRFVCVCLLVQPKTVAYAFQGFQVKGTVPPQVQEDSEARARANLKSNFRSGVKPIYGCIWEL